ncbi:Na+/H+ antiporter NhaA [Haematospirillum jordaniae]|uniref:Na(+)/H(+) antiporter NhaA n=1 Tax=Haematospirillum jordaniae TaxID=1549855 RepID=A0A143DFZ2_9PROT|nr:Na+/H+ antiporter NhaA [Haematospirillum jordaniae]AMW35672.1 hypothetical protein AY555_09085 [Haematospirillum jordaniae]NKD45132.1 Na+/H+ antiporter NhaA [Haematospirillum jordaniae]NKD56285.1 Na+/H+ antiporter NhaA [Haematospirillum jordaniae]NKD58342.1 Na+/H+ antiporter NhaA [Haematospirillum jordaniae]NKD66489.1 Na+/H+ antiporter NhaA [Haematospirillum jordaniae]
MALSMIRKFMHMEAAGGLCLVGAACIALLLANSAGAPFYQDFLTTKLAVTFNGAGIDKPLLLWINDGLMAVFFLLVGLEIKREVLEGELSSRKKALMPGIAALGGMIGPALVYIAFNMAWPDRLTGWAIPAATDIAFALGVMALAGKRVPATLKIFLLALAVMDDLGAIIIIAFFYTSHLSMLSLGLAVIAIMVLFSLNKAGVNRITPYVLVGVFLWVCVLKSGVHATLAGVVLGLAIPLCGSGQASESPLKHVEEALHPWVAFGIMPIFAFANAGVSLAGVTYDIVFSTITLGIGLGLFIGKQVGVMTFTWFASVRGIGALPKGVSWAQFYGMSVITGIGFTMSLFVGTLAFPSGLHDAEIRLGVLGGSLLSALVGLLILKRATPVDKAEELA